MFFVLWLLFHCRVRTLFKETMQLGRIRRLGRRMKRLPAYDAGIPEASNAFHMLLQT